VSGTPELLPDSVVIQVPADHKVDGHVSECTDQQMCGKSTAERQPATFCSADLVTYQTFDLAFVSVEGGECRRGDLNSYSTGSGGLIIGPELWLPAA
jgi:hypothetical protein